MNVKVFWCNYWGYVQGHQQPTNLDEQLEKAMNDWLEKMPPLRIISMVQSMSPRGTESATTSLVCTVLYELRKSRRTKK